MLLLEDPEVRVRLAVGELLRALAVANGSTKIWDETHGLIMDSIRMNFVSPVSGKSPRDLKLLPR